MKRYMVNNMRWAIFEDDAGKLYKKINDKHKGHRYKSRDRETDTADRGHVKLAFHNTINVREFITNSCVLGKDTADCGCSRFVFHGAINSQKPAKLACHRNR